MQCSVSKALNVRILNSSNGCTVPQEKGAGVLDCMKDVHEDIIKPILEECVQEKISGFEIPDDDEELFGAPQPIASVNSKMAQRGDKRYLSSERRRERR